MQALETAVRMDPLFVIARLDLARYYDHHGNQETVEQLFKEALEVHLTVLMGIFIMESSYIAR